jgi:hypothetical protein
VTPIPDNSPPNITLISPANDSFDIDGNVTFQYNATDLLSGIANCSLILNNTINQTDTSITESVVQEFNSILDVGDYSWSINCTDDAINANQGSSETRLLHVINCTDADNDTYSTEGGACGAIDCNDNNSAVNPGAAEVCGDSIDNNCNGQINENCDVGGGGGGPSPPSPPPPTPPPPEPPVIEPEEETITPEGEEVKQYSEEQVREIRRITSLDYDKEISGVTFQESELLISLKNTGNVSIKNLSVVIERPALTERPEIPHIRKVFGWDFINMMGWITKNKITDPRLLEWQVSDPIYYEILRPGEEIDVDLGLITPLTKAQFVDIKFKILSYGQEIYSETVPIRINTSDFLVIADTHKDENLIDIYFIITNLKDVDKDFSVELNINSKPDADYKPTSSIKGLFTSMFEGPSTVSMEWYGPFKVKAKDTVLFAYQYEYLDDFAGDYYLKYSLFEESTKVRQAAGGFNLSKITEQNESIMRRYLE